MSTRDDVAALERELAGMALDATKVRATRRRRTTTRISHDEYPMRCDDVCRARDDERLTDDDDARSGGRVAGKIDGNVG